MKKALSVLLTAAMAASMMAAVEALPTEQHPVRPQITAQRQVQRAQEPQRQMARHLRLAVSDRLPEQQRSTAQQL